MLQRCLDAHALQRGDRGTAGFDNRFSGFRVGWKTAEAVEKPRPPGVTPLKRGVNEKIRDHAEFIPDGLG